MCERNPPPPSFLAKQNTTCFFMMSLILCLKRVICLSTTFFSARYFLWHWVCDPWHAVKSQGNDTLTAHWGGSVSSRCTGMAPIQLAPITRTEKEYPLVWKHLTCVSKIITLSLAVWFNGDYRYFTCFVYISFTFYITEYHRCFKIILVIYDILLSYRTYISSCTTFCF